MLLDLLLFLDPYLDENGCQWMACPMYGTLPGCDHPRFHFQLYDLEREEQCKACDAITCEDDEN